MFYRLVIGVVVASGGLAIRAQAAELKLELLGVQKIWDQAPHNAFTDLMRFKDRWVCVFREGSAHVPGTDGTIRVLASDDGSRWSSVALIAETDVDLRDPKLSITPDGRLMLLIGASIYKPGPTDKPRERITTRGRVCLSVDGIVFSPPQKISIEGQWLWRVTWDRGVGYGVGYSIVRPMENRRIALWKTIDGVHYDGVVDPKIPNDVLPNESTIRFHPDQSMLVLIRNERRPSPSYLVSARPPYVDWTWTNLGNQIHGPNFIALPDGVMVYAGRDSIALANGKRTAKTVVGQLTTKSATPMITLPSGGDTSYPGLVWHDNLLWVSYYSSHEKKTAIYLAKLRRTDL